MIWLLRIVAAAAAGVSLYLLIVSLLKAGMPAGCGAGSGCAAVLTSRWAGAFGVPVSGLALLTYLMAFAATFFVHPLQSEQRRCTAWLILAAISASIVSAALWFIALQVFVIKAICPWCMTEHALGLAFAAIAHLAFHRRSTGAGDGGSSRLHVDRASQIGALVAGLMATAVLIAGQFLVPYKPAKVQRLSAGVNADTGPGPQRQIQLLDGRLQLSPHEQAMLGSADAEHVLVVLFDYCCPHCQATHGYLLEAMQRYPNQIALLTMPMPMSHHCNPNLDHTEARFEHSCELARLALAVWKAAPMRFAEFDQWLFESDMPREPAEARRKADELAGADAVSRALADPWIDQQIALSVEAYKNSGAERIPVILGAKLRPIVGEPDSAQQLMELLRGDLGLK